jgi:hypothetical protein
MTRYRLSSMLVALVCVGVLSSCSKGPELPAPPEPDLTGSWSLVMPAGFKYSARIEYMGNLRYRIAVEVNSGGVYEISGDELTMLNPGNDATRRYVWKIEDKDNLLLIKAPPVEKVGSDYTGAVLSR